MRSYVADSLVPSLSGSPSGNASELWRARRHVTRARFRLVPGGAYLRSRGIPATIPDKVDQQANRRNKGSAGGRSPTFDKTVYRQRHAVECGINQHKQHCGFATRHDKLAVRYDATVQITNINIWLRDLASRA